MAYKHGMGDGEWMMRVEKKIRCLCFDQRPHECILMKRPVQSFSSYVQLLYWKSNSVYMMINGAGGWELSPVNATNESKEADGNVWGTLMGPSDQWCVQDAQPLGYKCLLKPCFSAVKALTWLKSRQDLTYSTADVGGAAIIACRRGQVASRYAWITNCRLYCSQEVCVCLIWTQSCKTKIYTQTPLLQILHNHEMLFFFVFHPKKTKTTTTIKTQIQKRDKLTKCDNLFHCHFGNYIIKLKRNKADTLSKRKTLIHHLL